MSCTCELMERVQAAASAGERVIAIFAAAQAEKHQNGGNYGVRSM